MYVVFCNMDDCITVAHYAFYFFLFCNLNQKKGKKEMLLLFSVRVAVWERAIYSVYLSCLS